MTYESDIEIDEQQLDLMWLDQPRVMARYCTVAAEAQRQMGVAKEQMDYVEANLSRAIRTKPDDYGVVAGSRGVTEDAIKSAIQTNADYREAVTAYLNAKYEAEVAVGVVRAFDQRKSALENLVRLHGQSYFASPRGAGDMELGEKRLQRDAATQSKVRVRSRGRAA
jgi:hypothetical protein